MSRQGRSFGMLLACSAVAIGPWMAACGSRTKGSTTPVASVSSDPSASTAPKKTETVTGEAPPPPPKPGDASKLTGSSREHYDKGIAAYNVGDIAGAMAAFQQAVSAEPKAYEAHYAYGVSLEHASKFTDALEHYREAYKINPNFEAAVAAYGFLLFRQGSRTEAETFLNDQSTKNPKAILVMTALGEIKSLQGDSNAAQTLAANVLTVEAKFEPAMVLIARDHYRRSRVELAGYVLKAILDGQPTAEEREKGLPAKTNPPRAPNNAEAHVLRAIMLQRQGERLEAAKWYESASKLRPDLVDARLQLGLIRLEANDGEGAVEALEKAVAFAGTNVEAHLGLGEAYRLVGGKAAEAKREYTWVTSSAAPAQTKALAQYDLGLLFFLTPGIDSIVETARYDKAIEHFNIFKAAKGSSAGPSWPSDVEDLLEQARRLRTAAAAGGGATSAKPAPSGKPAPSPSAKPAPSASTSSKPVTSASAPPSSSTPPKPSASTAPSTAPPKPKETF